MTQNILDVRKLLCPLPVIKVQQKIKTLAKGDTLLVFATDPGVMHDIPAWCKVHGYRIISKEMIGKAYHVEIAVD